VKGPARGVQTGLDPGGEDRQAEHHQPDGVAGPADHGVRRQLRDPAEHHPLQLPETGLDRDAFAFALDHHALAENAETARSISLLATKMVPVSLAIPLADTPTADYFPTAAICAATSRRGLRMGEGASPDRRRITT
jgi:hypothetical protein